MKISDWLQSATKKLSNVGIETARLDCLILAEDATGKDRAYLLAHPEHNVKGQTLHKLDEQMSRRLHHEPLAYIRGKTEFYGRLFSIDRRVLEPRPESETMINILKALYLTNKDVIADIGTGSGALAITTKLELPYTAVIGVDIDKKCLSVANKNARDHGVSVTFLNGDLVQPIRDNLPTVLLCNLPYVPDNWHINQAARFEPDIALFGGKDGLDIYRKLFEQLKNLQKKPLYVITECLPPQHETLAKIASDAGYKIVQTDDFIQLYKKP